MPAIYHDSDIPDNYINVLGVRTQFGAVYVSIRTETTSPYTALVTDHVILVDATSGAFTVNLPTVASSGNIVYHIKKIDASANAVTIDGDGAETIDGAATQTLTTQYESLMIVSDGTSWHII